MTEQNDLPWSRPDADVLGDIRDAMDHGGPWEDPGPGEDQARLGTVFPATPGPDPPPVTGNARLHVTGRAKK